VNPELRELYQAVILDHNKKPRNFRVLEEANRSAQGFNPLCGDRVTVYLDVEDGVVRKATFQGSGCAISTASASLMTQAVEGKPEGEVRRMFERFHRVVTGSAREAADTEGLGKLAVFAGVREFPMRVKCATLVWHALQKALEGKEEVATTE
jgi:nitrogen fixation NifU-like protein